MGQIGSISRAAVAALALSLPLLGGPAWAADAKQIYDVNCASCHGPGGKGDGPAGKFLNPKPQDFATVLAKQSDADVEKVIAEGGKAVGKSAVMPGYSGKLTGDEIKALVQYVKGMK